MDKKEKDIILKMIFEIYVIESMAEGYDQKKFLNDE